jgi:spore coat polysaccharide biosynthesis protein SpsF (cytidylyltransferase family)
MNANIISDVWEELKRYINIVDRQEAAEIVVQVLMDNDFDVEDIQDAFKGDRNIKTALTSYLDNDKDYSEDEEELEEEDYNEDDWEN